MAKIRAVSVSDKDQELWQRGQLVARRRGISMSQLIIQAIQKEVTKWETPDPYILEDEEVEAKVV
jgi:post-segregation antitoxin (ccd killing protein)